MTWLFAVVLRPFVALVLFGLICLPVRLAIQRWVPDGVVKRFLLLEVRKRVARRRPYR
jgi:hypothetical protein